MCNIFNEKITTARYSWKKVFCFAGWYWHIDRFPCFTKTAKTIRTVIFCHWPIFNFKKQVNVSGHYSMFYLKKTFQAVINRTRTAGCLTLHKKWSFPLGTFSVNVAKSAGWMWSHLLKKSLIETSFFVQC